ncbi:MAG: hypothetical protein IIV87_04940 [Oscillospiraceae bacterium]|nr:hypothetical protein [Oscillospiraceae bacterium]
MKKQSLLVVLTLGTLLLALSVWSWLKPADAYSDTERRHLSQMPTLSVQSILNKHAPFMQKFESYAVDQFPMREQFRTLNSAFGKYLLAQKQINNIYLENGYAADPEYPLNEESLQWALDSFSGIHDRLLADSKVYFAVVPDKAYYMHGCPTLDYDEMFSAIRAETDKFASWVDLTEHLSLDDYYKTDTHWRQEAITDVADALLQAMDASAQPTYTEHPVTDRFFGVYRGQLALAMKPETLTALYADGMDTWQVTCFDNGTAESISLYDTEKANGKDGYEMYLSGPLALITIENPNAQTERELVMFRDSFGSSLAPLLASSYRKTTLVDTRYLSPTFVGNFVDFADADVLFLYSTLVLNSAKGQILP